MRKCINEGRPTYSEHESKYRMYKGERLCRKCQKRHNCHICGGRLHRGEEIVHGTCMPQQVLETILRVGRLTIDSKAQATYAIQRADRMHEISRQIEKEQK